MEYHSRYVRLRLQFAVVSPIDHVNVRAIMHACQLKHRPNQDQYWGQDNIVDHNTADGGQQKLLHLKGFWLNLVFA